MKKIFYLLLGSVFALGSDSHGQTLSTYAGTGAPGYSGNGGAATAAKLYGPMGIAVDGSGNLYIADRYNNCIRKVDIANGNISNVAGNDTAGYTGDTVAATTSRLKGPMAVAVDSVGNIYIADRDNHRIRKVLKSNGKIYTIAGTGVAGYSGDNGIATAAKINGPTGVAVDHRGNIYFADQINSRVRKIDATGKISTVCGTGANGFNGDTWPSATFAQLYFPTGVAIDSADNLYIADKYNMRIRKVDTNGIITTFAASLNYPVAVALDKWGAAYVAEEGSNKVRKFVPNHFTLTLAGTGTSGSSEDGSFGPLAPIGNPQGVAIDDSGIVYFSESTNNKIRTLTSTVGTEDVQGSDLQLSVYPNPVVNGSMTLNFATTHIQDVDVVITNVTGQTVMNFRASTGKAATLHIAQPAGIYFVAAKATDGSWSKRAEFVIAQ